MNNTITPLSATEINCINGGTSEWLKDLGIGVINVVAPIVGFAAAIKFIMWLSKEKVK